jgi:transposase
MALTDIKIRAAKLGARLVKLSGGGEQLDLAIADLEETEAEEETKSEIAAPEKQKAKRERTGIKPARRPLPDNLPRDRIAYPAPCACGKCGGTSLRKLGEAVTESLECEPRRWKAAEHVREKFSCRDCEGITEPPAPSHPIARGRAGPSLLAMIQASKFLLHQPLNRQAPRRGLHQMRTFKRNDAILEVLPIGVMHFPGTGIQDNLADKAKKLRIPVWKFGGA